VYEYDIILSTIFPEIFPEKRVCSAGNGFRKNGYGPVEILTYAKAAGRAYRIVLQRSRPRRGGGRGFERPSRAEFF
jgi:hypothetical protein